MVTKNGTKWHHVPPDTMHWGGYNITSVVSLPKMLNLNLTMKRLDLNMGYFTKNKNKNKLALYSSKLLSSWKTKKAERPFQIIGHQRYMTNKCGTASGRRSIVTRDSVGDNWAHLNSGCGNLSVSSFLILIIVLRSCQWKKPESPKVLGRCLFSSCQGLLSESGASRHL